MNLLEKCTNKEIKLFKDAGISIEDKDYKEDDLRRFGSQMEEFILSHSAKNGEISRLHLEYDPVFKIMGIR